MKNTSLLFICLFCAVLLSAQHSGLSHQSVIKQNGNWLKMLPDSRVEVDQFFDIFLFQLGLDANYHFELLDKSTDELGFCHYRYSEHFKGIPIEGGTYILHTMDGFVTHANGKLIREISDNEQMSVFAEDALDISKDFMGSEVFYWEVPEMETLIKQIKNNPEATFFPKAELVYAQSQFGMDSEKYRLSWKHEIYATNPDQKKTVYVDVTNGDIINAIDGIHYGSVVGEAKTRYHGVRSIITDSISPTEYRLIDTTRGGGIKTYDMNENVDDYSLAVDFVDEDNYWDNDNAEFDNAATDAHWGAEMFYDYMLQEHDRDSYDGKGSVMISYVHYNKNFRNAFWNGNFVTYGDGSGNPFTSIDVVAHEFTHGVTEFSAGLIYKNESGALNESFSDIFGTAVEAFALQEEADWIMGRENFALRNISNPNAFGHPDTYQGLNWHNAPTDNGGVHINSGVQNFWFYLLSEGGSGTNDNGDAYEVDSLGMNVAAAIAYRNLTVYLTESSNYMDARIGSLQAAADLYGSCSDEVLQVSKAWHAVGVGSETITPDFQLIEVLSPFTSCEHSMEEKISMSVRFNPSGCNLSLEPGEEIEVSYQVDTHPPVVELIVLDEILNEGDLFIYEFNTTADLSIPKQYLIDYKVSFSGDSITSNNEIIEYELTNSFIFDGSKVLAFEHRKSIDSFYVNHGVHAEGKISRLAGNSGRKGYLMQGFGVTPNNVTIINTEENNYTANPDFISTMCLCVDLSTWDNAYLNFDLKQTYSPFYFTSFGIEIAHMIAMRVTIDGLQIGEQFHPQSNNSDPYLTHKMDISSYAGSSFSICFESVNFLNDKESPDSIGDKSLLDNIYFSQSNVTGLEDIQLSNVNIYPNPTSGLLSIALNEPGTYELEVIDLLGHVVKIKHITSDSNPVVLDLSNLTKGVYMISIRSEDFYTVQKVLLE